MIEITRGEAYLKFAGECRIKGIDAFAVVSGDKSAPTGAVLEWAMIEADIEAQPLTRKLEDWRQVSRRIDITLD